MWPPRPGGISPKRNRGFAAAAASFFLSDQKETRRRIAGGYVRKESAAAVPCAFAHDSPDPLFYGSVEGVPRHLRPARWPQEGYLTVITAVLLNELDRLLLQDAMRLSGTAYTVDGGAGRFSCVGADVSLARGRPQAARYGKRIFSSTVSSGGYIQ